MSILSAHDLPARRELTADVVVVGSGAAGAVVAAELAEAGRRVIILEEGPHVPASEYGRLRPSQTMRRMWRDGGLTFAVGVGDTPMINVMMGRCVGGSSALTGGVCFRTPSAVLHRWSQKLGLTGLSERALEPCFVAVEKASNVHTVPTEMRSVSTRLFAVGAERVGATLQALKRNTRGCRGCGRCNFGCPHQAKLSVDLTYLPRAFEKGARLVADCRVERILLEGARATGVLARAAGSKRKPFVVRAGRVVLAAGAYASPQLLMRSGIGRSSNQVGRNLTLHPGFRVMARFDERVEGWKGALQSAYTDAFESERITLVGMFIPPGVLAATLPGIGPRHVERAQQIPHIAVFGGMVHDSAAGRVHSGFGHPFISYRMHARDRQSTNRLLYIMAEIYFAAGAREVFLPVLGLGGIGPDQLKTLDIARLPAKKLECTSQHPLGTCRMGISPEHSVVDPNGRCWDVEHLYVADGSTLPTSLGVNPQLSIMAMATRIAWRMREERAE